MWGGCGRWLAVAEVMLVKDREERQLDSTRDVHGCVVVIGVKP